MAGGFQSGVLACFCLVVMIGFSRSLSFTRNSPFVSRYFVRSSALRCFSLRMSSVAGDAPTASNSVASSISNLLSAKTQAVDYTSLMLSVEELARSEDIVPSKVENIVQLDENNLIIGVKGLTSEVTWLQFCWSASAARMGLAYPPPRTEANPYSFGATLRALLKGKTLTRIRMPSAFERIVEVEFSDKVSSSSPKWILVLEVIGSRSNLVLVHGQGIDSDSSGDRDAGSAGEIGEIAACAYQVSATSSVRALQTGLQYSLPPAGGGVFCPQQAAAELSVDEFRTRLLDLEQRTITANAATAAANANAVESDVYSNTDKDKGQGRNNGKKKRRGRSDSPGLSLARALTLLYVWRGGYRGLSPNVAKALLLQADLPSDISPSGVGGVGVPGEEQLDRAFERLFESFQGWAACIDRVTDTGDFYRSPSPMVMEAVSAESTPEEEEWGEGGGKGGGGESVISTCTRIRVVTGQFCADFSDISAYDGKSVLYDNNVVASAADTSTDPDKSTSKSSHKEDEEREGEGNSEGKFPLSRFFQHYYEQRRVLDVLKRVQSSCQKKLAQRLKKSTQLSKDFNKQRDACGDERAAEVQMTADLVTAYTYNWQHSSINGAVGRVETLQTFDFETGDEVLVPIPEGIAPSKYAKNLYAKVRKMTRARSVLEELSARAAMQLEYLQEIEACLSSVDTYSTSTDTSTSTYTSTDEYIIDLNSQRTYKKEMVLLRKIRADTLVMREIELDLLQLESGGLVDSSVEIESIRALRQERQEQEDYEDEGEWKGGKGGNGQGKLKGKEKYLAHRERVLQKKEKVVRESVERKRGKKKGKQAGESSNSSNNKGKKKSPLSGIMVLDPANTFTATGTLAGEEDGAEWEDCPTLLVGRSSSQNERITFQLARDHHVWFHAQGVPGSHCLLRLPESAKGEASDRALQFAADVAAYYSKARDDTKVPVMYAFPKQLKKPKGGAQGMVSVRKQEGTVVGRPDAGKKWVEQFDVGLD